MTNDMLGSCAWRACSNIVRNVIFRVMIEHMAHGGMMNGELAITHDEFADYGARRKSLTAAIAEAEALGLIRCTSRGQRPFGSFKGCAATYRIEWLPANTGTPASNGWKSFKSVEEALAAARDARDRIKARRKPRKDWIERLPELRGVSSPQQDI